MTSYKIYCNNPSQARSLEIYLGLLGVVGNSSASVDSFLFDNEIIEDVAILLTVNFSTKTYDVELGQPSFVSCILQNGSSCKIIDFEQCMNVKQVIVWRKDLGVRLGKKMAQASHASMAPIFNIMRQDVDETGVTFSIKDELFSPFMMYKLGAFKKIVVYVNNEEELLQLYNKVKQHSVCFHNQKLPVALITDSGLTEFNGVPTNTCIGIGPYYSSVIDLYTKELPLL